MGPQDYLFYIFAALTLGAGLLVVVNPFSRNPVTSAMFLVISMAAVAGLFVMLHAFFLAAVQILVYAGAVMVLFLFVIMLLDLGEEERRRLKLFGLASAFVCVGALVFIMVNAIVDTSPGTGLAEPELAGATKSLGTMLFADYLLPFEIVSVLLLVAMVGVVLLTRKDLK